MARSPEFLLWSALISGTAVVYGLLFGRSIPLASRWRECTGGPVWQPAAIYAALGSLVLVFLWIGFAPAPFPAANVTPVTRSMLVLGIVAAAPTVLGFWLVAARLQRISALLASEAPISRADVLTGLLDCRQNMQSCLSFMSVIVSTALLTTGALRRAQLANGVDEKQFPADAVLLYGAFFTLVTLLVYVPTFLAWRSRSLHFVGLLYPVPPDARPTEEWTAGRTRLTQLLGTDATISKSLSAAFGILAPLATSAITLVIPALK